MIKSFFPKYFNTKLYYQVKKALQAILSLKKEKKKKTNIKKVSTGLELGP